MALICIVALVAFAIMGIFSAKYRAYAKEAFHCFVNTVTLRKCDTKLDEKIKAEIVSKILPFSTTAAKAIHAHFEIISTIFVILMFASTIYSGISVYNYVAYGNCNGPAGGFCILKELADGAKIGKTVELSPPKTSEGQSFGNINHEVVVYEVGCYACPYTAKAEPAVQQLYSEYGDRVQFVYKTFPYASRHPYGLEAALASWCAYEQGTEKYLAYRKSLFDNQAKWVKEGNSTIAALASSSGLEMVSFNSCFESGKYQQEVNKLIDEGVEMGVYGTPTFFIGNKSFVGAVTYEELKKAVEEELKK